MLNTYLFQATYHEKVLSQLRHGYEVVSFGIAHHSDQGIRHHHLKSIPNSISGSIMAWQCEEM